MVNRIANSTFTLDGTRYQVHEACFSGSFLTMAQLSAGQFLLLLLPEPLLWQAKSTFTSRPCLPPQQVFTPGVLRS